MGVYPGTAHAQSFKVPPIISRTGKATDFKFGQYIQSLSEQKPIKNSREKGAWRIQGLPIFFGYPLYYPRNGWTKAGGWKKPRFL